MSVEPLLVATPRLIGLFASCTDNIKWRKAEEQKQAHTEAAHVEGHPKVGYDEAPWRMRVLTQCDLFLLRESRPLCLAPARIAR